MSGLKLTSNQKNHVELTQSVELKIVAKNENFKIYTDPVE